MKKRLLSLIMAVMMVVVLVVPAAAATTDTTSDGTVTVYVTYGMFTEGGYDTAAKAPKAQEYNSDAAPTHPTSRLLKPTAPALLWKTA